jgi:transcription elongation factor Elf1
MKKSEMELKIKLLEQDVDVYKRLYDAYKESYKEILDVHSEVFEKKEHYKNLVDEIKELCKQKETQLCEILTKSLFGELEIKDYVWMAANYPNSITIPKHIQCSIIDYGALEVTKADSNEDE